MDHDINNSISILQSLQKHLEKDQFTYNFLIIDSTLIFDDTKIVDYFHQIQNLTQSFPYYMLNFNRSSDFSKIFRLQERQLSDSIRSFTIQNTQFLLLYSQDIFKSRYAISDKQKREILEMMKLKENQTLNQFNLMITDRPIYCSGLSDICTSQALLLKGQYQDYINKGQVDLVISGNSEQYERTYPKFEYKNQDQSDPTYIQNAKYPVYVNINGPRSIQSLDEWGLQKQQWSAMLRKQASYGMIQIAPFQAYQLSYSQFDQNGNQIDNLIIEKKQAISQFIKNTLLSILKIVLMLAFGKNQLKYKQAIFEGIPIIDDERGQANKNSSLNTIQHQRLTTLDPEQLNSLSMDNEEGVELMDLSYSRRNNIIHRGIVHFDKSSLQSITDDNFQVSTQAKMSSIKSQPPNFQFGIIDEHFVIRNANRDLMEDLEEIKTTVSKDRMAPFQQFMAQRNQVTNKDQQKLAAERMRREIENRLNEDIVDVKKTKKTKVKQRKNQDKSK